MRLHSWESRSSQKNTQIADICPSLTGDEEGVQRFKEAVRITAREILVGIETERTGAFDGGFVGDGARGGAVAVDSVGPRAQDDETFVCLRVGETDGAAQDGFEISAAAPVASHGTRELTAGKRAEGSLG